MTDIRSIEGINVYSPSLQPLHGRILIGHLTNDSQQIWCESVYEDNFWLLNGIQMVNPLLRTSPTYNSKWTSSHLHSLQVIIIFSSVRLLLDRYPMTS